MKEIEKLYYEEDEGEFYWVKETPKTFIIDWVEKNNCDNERTPLDQNVRWKHLKVPKVNNGKHCLKEVDEGGGILIYPLRAGLPFYLEPATMTHITSEISSCIQWGISSDYYKNLLKNIKYNKNMTKTLTLLLVFSVITFISYFVWIVYQFSKIIELL